MNMSTEYKSLINKSVFVTGGATGIGAAIVEAFVRQGAKVAFIDIDELAASQLIAKLPQTDNIHFICSDATNPEQLQHAINDAANKHQGIDILINNVANDMRHSPDKISQEDWNQCMAINLNPAFFASQAAFQHMKKGTSGSIINFSSINALLGPAKMVGYNTAKAGLLGMTKSLAQDFGRFNIRVNAILPGWVATDKQLSTWLTPEEEQKWMQSMALKQRIEPSDVAKLALFLASDDSAMITGQHITIDGGRI